MPTQTSREDRQQLPLSLAACKLGSAPRIALPSTDSEAGVSECFPVHIRQVEGRGRGFFAARDILPGETVFRAAPLAWAISEDWVKNTCWWCFAHDDRRPLPIKTADSPASACASTHVAAKQGQRVHYKGVFCSNSCMQKAVHAHGGQNSWTAYLALLDCLEYEVRSHKIKSVRSGKSLQNTKDCAKLTAVVCELVAADTSVATFATNTKLESFGEEAFVEAEFDPNDITDDQLVRWITSVWDTIVAHHIFSDELPDSSQRELLRLITNGVHLENATCKPNQVEPCFEWKHNVTESSAADRDIAPLFALDFMQSNEVGYIRIRLQQHETALSGNDPLLTPATLIPVRIPWMPLPSQIESSWWGASFKAAASSFALLSSAWSRAALTHSVGTLSHALFRKVYFREMANSFGLYDPPTSLASLCSDTINSQALNSQCEQEWVGFCIYPTAVYFNHSCHPNVAKVRFSREMQFVATSAIKKDEELYISYGCITDAVEERQKRLKEHFFFMCACERCVSESTSLD